MTEGRANNQREDGFLFKSHELREADRAQRGRSRGTDQLKGSDQSEICHRREKRVLCPVSPLVFLPPDTLRASLRYASFPAVAARSWTQIRQSDDTNPFFRYRRVNCRALSQREYSRAVYGSPDDGEP